MANINEEKAQVLKMIEDGKINAAEGLELLQALENNKAVNEAETGEEKVKWIKVRVKTIDGKTKVKVNLPVSLASVGFKLATKFAPELKDSGLENFDLDEIFMAIKNGAEGKIADVDDEESGTKVEVYVE